MPKPTYAGTISGAGAQTVPPVFTNASPPKGKVNYARSGKSAKPASGKTAR